MQIDPIPSAAVPTNDTGNYMSFYLTLLTTTSRGNVTIHSTDTQDNPVVDLNWLATETDQQLAVAAFRRAREIAQATGITVGPEYTPGSGVQTDEDILEYIKESVTLIFHAVATCESLHVHVRKPLQSIVQLNCHPELIRSVYDRCHGPKGRP